LQKATQSIPIVCAKNMVTNWGKCYSVFYLFISRHELLINSSIEKGEA
jgi:hypothetical protein